MNEVEDGTAVEADEDIAALTAASVFGGVLDQVKTARLYPRVISQFREELRELVGSTPEIAHTMNYRIPRGKDDDGNQKWIEGPSVRLAEAAVASWGHTRSGAMVVGADATHVIARGFCHDLQKNNFVAFEQKRRITSKNGTRFNEDMITVTGAAASKIAWRNAIFGVIPRSYVEEARQYAKAVAAKSITSVVDSRKAALEWWTKNGGTEIQMLALFNRRKLEDMTVEDLLNLKSIKTSIEVEERITFKDLLQQIATDKPTTVRPDGLSAEAIRAAATVEGRDDAKKPDQVGGTPEAGPVPPAAPASTAPAAAPEPQPVATTGGKRPRARKGEPLVPPAAPTSPAPAASPQAAPAAAAAPATAEREPGQDDDDAGSDDAAQNASLFGDE